MNAFFTALDSIELQTHFRIANPNSLQETIQAAQRTKSYRLTASGAAGTSKTIYLTSVPGEAEDKVRTMVQKAISDCLKVQTPAAALTPVASAMQQTPAQKLKKASTAGHPKSHRKVGSEERAMTSQTANGTTTTRRRLDSDTEAVSRRTL